MLTSISSRLLLRRPFCFSESVKRVSFFEQRNKDFMTARGYGNCKTYKINVNDDLDLTFFRIQSKSQKEIQSGKKVVYLQHGLFDSSNTWIVNEPENAPAFILAEQGYDVWLGNIRGNIYSQPKRQSRDFWYFSFDEMGSEDLPAAFKFIGKETGQKINYIGHSQGTLIMFIAMSLKDKRIDDIIRNNVASFSALGPVAYLSNMVLFGGKTDPLTKLLLLPITDPIIKRGASQLLDLKHKLGTILKVPILLPVDDVISLASILKQGSKSQILGIILNALSHNSYYDVSGGAGYDNMEVIHNEVFRAFPSGTSLKNFLHFMQLYFRGTFCKWDGEQYNLNNINANFPIHLFVGSKDYLATQKDSDRIMEEMNSVPNKDRTVYQGWGHGTFMWGANNRPQICVKDIVEKVIKKAAV